MKKIFSILSLLSIMTWGTLKAQNVEDVLDVKSLNFQGIEYQLGWSAHNSVQCIQEYFPKGQVPESYTDMFTISVFTNIAPGVTPEMAVIAKEAELKARKEKTKDVWNWSVMTNDETNEACIDFICCSGKDDKLDIVEFDVHRYRIIQVDGKPALQLLFYSHRAYGEGITEMMNNLKDIRGKALLDIVDFKIDCNVKLK
jgi:hypothetical protein